MKEESERDWDIIKERERQTDIKKKQRYKNKKNRKEKRKKELKTERTEGRTTNRNEKKSECLRKRERERNVQELERWDYKHVLWSKKSLLSLPLRTIQSFEGKQNLPQILMKAKTYPFITDSHTVQLEVTA